MLAVVVMLQLILVVVRLQLVLVVVRLQLVLVVVMLQLALVAVFVLPPQPRRTEVFCSHALRVTAPSGSQARQHQLWFQHQSVTAPSARHTSTAEQLLLSQNRSVEILQIHPGHSFIPPEWSLNSFQSIHHLH